MLARTWGHLARNGHASAFKHYSWAAVFLVALALLIASHRWVQDVHVQVGAVAPQDITASRKVVDTPKLIALRRAALAQVQPVYVTDDSAIAQALGTMRRLFQRVALAQKSLPQKPTSNKLLALWQAKVGLTVSAPVVETILGLSSAQLKGIEQDEAQVLSGVMSRAGYKPSQSPAELQAVRSAVEDLGLSNARTAFMWAVGAASLRPTLVYSASETTLARAKALSSVPIPYIYPGQIVVSKGTRVTQDQVRILHDLNLLRPHSNLWALLGALLETALVMAVGLLFIRRFARRAFTRESAYVMVGLVAVVTLGLARLLVTVAPPLIPLAFASMLLALFFPSLTAAVLGVLIGILVAAATGLSPGIVTALMLGALVGALTMPRSAQRLDVIRVGAFVAMATLMGFVATRVLDGEVFNRFDVWTGLLWSVANGAASAVIVVGSLPFWESVFDLLTSVKLLELSNPKHPMLRRLLLEAPGTYHHSLMVANLAEAAADAIGADGLLARVGAYFHDIGKVLRPYFFVDNQFGGENPHDKIAPSLSTLIVTAHVTDGLQLAREARLPVEIQAFIPEHHGTTLVKYFYNKAVAAGAETVREEEFRYPGPRPQTRETAIVMLADTCEAAVRAAKDPSQEAIGELVRKLIRDKLYDGQLDESNLTLRDLETIAQAFVHVLAGVFHSRIEYPEEIRRMREKEGARPVEGASQ